MLRGAGTRRAGIARHNVSVKDVRVRNVPTNLAEFGGKWRNGNSMFVIESQGLCIVHISHLHHVLSEDQLRDLGRIDIAFAPIDGMWTMSHQELFEDAGQDQADAGDPDALRLDGRGAGLHRPRQGEVAGPPPRRPPPSSSASATLPRKTEVLFLAGR